MQGIHPWIHRSHLRIYLIPDPKAVPGLPEPASKDPVTIDASGQEEWEVERVLKDRIYRKGRQFLIHWKGYDEIKQLGNPSMPLKEPVPPSEPTGLKPITKQSLSTSLGHITKFGQLGQFSNQNTCLYPQNLTLTDFGHPSKTLTTLRPKPVLLSPPLTNLRWKPNGIYVFSFISFLLGGM